MSKPRARWDHWFWEFFAPKFGDFSRWAWTQQMRTEAESTEYRRIHKTKAADGFYEVKDGMMRLWMSVEEYERLSKNIEDKKKEAAA